MEEALKQYDLHIEYAEEPEEPIDFEIRDKQGDLYATVWGSHPTDDIQIDCTHDFVEYEDDETVGECPICGATCDWHYEDDGEGHQTRVPHDWSNDEKIGGIVGEYLQELQKKW